MSSRKTSDEAIKELRQAKKAVLEKFGDRKWFRGVGIAPSKRGLCLRLNVDRTAVDADEDVPKEFHGHRLDIVYIKGYKKR